MSQTDLERILKAFTIFFARKPPPLGVGSMTEGLFFLPASNLWMYEVSTPERLASSYI